MKRHAQIIVLFLCIGFFTAIACWYWLRREEVETPEPGPFATNVIRIATMSSNMPSASVVSARRVEEIVGIGAILKPDPNTGGIMIMGSLPNSPAGAAGLTGNFLIRKIDDTSADGMKLRDCVEALRGEEGTKVRLELLDLEANETKTVELTRRRMQL